MKKKEMKEKVELKKETAVPVKTTAKDLTRSEKPDFNGPFTLMRHIAEDMENMFADFDLRRGLSPRMSLFDRDPVLFEGRDFWKSPFELERPDFFKDFSPPVEMLERNGNLIVRADLPGMEKDDVKVEIKDGSLTIEGERKQASKEEGEGFYRSERSYGSFYRQLPLPEGTKTEDAKATFKNGVLEVTLAAPKIAKSGKRVEITDEDTKKKAAKSGS